MNKAIIRVLIADDHPIVRDGLNAVINDQPDMEVVAEASNGRDTLQLALQHATRCAVDRPPDAANGWS